MILINKHNLKPSDIKSITARLPESGAHTVNDREMPDINLQYLFAVALLDGRISFEAAHSVERMTDPDVLELRSKMPLIGDPELTHADPEWQCIVEITTNDGRDLKEHVVSFKGKADNPLTTEEVSEKALDLMEPVIGKTQSDKLIDAINNLETLDSVRKLRPLLSV